MTPHISGWIPPPLAPSYSPVVVAFVNKGRLAWSLPTQLPSTWELGGANAGNPVIRAVKALPAWSSRGIQSTQTMTESQTADAEQNGDHSESVLEALQPGVLVQFNTSDPGLVTTDELEVYRSWNGNAIEFQSTLGSRYRVREKNGSLVLFGEEDGWFTDRVTPVTTIEVIGVAE